MAYTYANLSTPGDTTSSLLDVISNNSATIRSGNVFTISIGSNNLLGPAIQAIIGLYGLKMTDFQEPDGSDMILALAKKVMADPRPDLTFAQLMTPNNPKAIALNANWVLGHHPFHDALANHHDAAADTRPIRQGLRQQLVQSIEIFCFNRRPLPGAL